jgi:hypothetical protein
MAENPSAAKAEATKITVVLPDNRKFDLAPEMAKQDAETIRKALRGTAPEIALSKVEEDETDAEGHRTIRFVKEVTRKGRRRSGPA